MILKGLYFKQFPFNMYIQNFSQPLHNADLNIIVFLRVQVIIPNVPCKFRFVNSYCSFILPLPTAS